MSNTADSSRRPLKSLTIAMTRYKFRASIASPTIGRGGAGNTMASMSSSSGNSPAENDIRSPVGRDVRSVRQNNQILTTGRGGAGNTTSAKVSKRRMSESEKRAVLAAEMEVVQQHKREKVISSPLVTGRGGVGNIRKSKQDKSKLSPTLSQTYRPSTSRTRISSLVLDISPEASVSSHLQLSTMALRKRRHSFTDPSITDPQATTFATLPLKGSETDGSWGTTDSLFTDCTSYVFPEATFGAPAEAHDDISLNDSISIPSRYYASSLNPSFTDTDGSCSRRRVPNTVVPFEEPPLFFYLAQMSPSNGQQSRRQSMGIEPPKESGSRPLTSPSSTSLSSSFSFDKYYTAEPLPRQGPVIMLPPEQDATPISPLLPPPRFGSPTSDHGPARTPLSASSAPKPVSYQTTLNTQGFGERGGNRPSISSSSCRSSTATEKVFDRSYKPQEAASRTLRTPTTPTSRQTGAPFIPFEAIVNPRPRLARAISPSAIDSLTRPIKISDTPPQIPITVFVDPRPCGDSTSPTSSLAPTLRSSSPASQYESFTPTFGTTPLPPLPAVSRRGTYTSLAPSEYTLPLSPTSTVSISEEGIEMVAQFEA